MMRIWMLLPAGILSAALWAGDWPQVRGPQRNGISKETGLLQEWPKDGPPLAWKGTGLGKGMGGIAVSKGRIYTTGDDAEKMQKLLDAVEGLDDVQEVYTNAVLQ